MSDAIRAFKATLPTPEEFKRTFIPPPVPRPGAVYDLTAHFERYRRFYNRFDDHDLSEAQRAYEDFYICIPTLPPHQPPVLSLDTITPASRYTGMWIVAPPGRGKTNLLHNLIAEDLATDEKTIILMESKGDLINHYRTYPGAVVITPNNVSINPLQFGTSIRTLEFLEYLFSALLEVEMTGLQKTLFSAILEVLLHIPNATIETFRQVLDDGPVGYEDALEKCRPICRDFFTKGKPTAFNSSTYKDTKDQLKWRLYLLLRNEYLERIFTSPTTSHNFFELLDSQRLIVIDNSKDELGEQGAEFFGRFFIAIVWMAAISRSKLRDDQKVPVYFYIDECHDVIRRDTKFKTIIEQCRSQKIAMTIAHQYISQISEEVRGTLYNCGIRIANSDDDAAQLAPRLRTEPENIYLPVGQFACFVRDHTPSAVTISVPEFDTRTIPRGQPYEPPRPATRPVETPYKSEAVERPPDEIEDF